MVRELRHLGLEGGADEQRRRAGQYDHPDDPRLGADLGQHAARLRQAQAWSPSRLVALAPMAGVRHPEEVERDRKSTRLNSSHLVISYAVFCLKKKKKKK